MRLRQPRDTCTLLPRASGFSNGPKKAANDAKKFKIDDGFRHSCQVQSHGHPSHRFQQ